MNNEIEKSDEQLASEAADLILRSEVAEEVKEFIVVVPKEAAHFVVDELDFHRESMKLSRMANKLKDKDLPVSSGASEESLTSLTIDKFRTTLGTSS